MRSFAVSNGRDIKAAKIEAVLCDALGTTAISGLSILDVGAGSGHIAAHFASKNAVTAADVENQLCVDDNFLNFVQIEGPSLPFGDASFDVVILNQVLTYIPNQIFELMEVRRILKPDGICYISLPNRLFPRDPHSKLPFVHYLPRALHQRILHWLSGASEEVRMHALGGMTRLFEAAGFTWKDYTINVLHDPARFHGQASLKLPAWHWLSRISPTNIFILRIEAQG